MMSNVVLLSGYTWVRWDISYVSGLIATMHTGFPIAVPVPKPGRVTSRIGTFLEFGWHEGSTYMRSWRGLRNY